MGQHGQAPVAHPGDLVHRARIAFDGATLAGGMGGLGLCLLTPLFRRTEAREHALLTLLALQREAQPVEDPARLLRSEEHTSDLQSLMRISYAVFRLKKK